MRIVDFVIMSGVADWFAGAHHDMRRLMPQDPCENASVIVEHDKAFGSFGAGCLIFIPRIFLQHGFGSIAERTLPAVFLT